MFLLSEIFKTSLEFHRMYRKSNEATKLSPDMLLHLERFLIIFVFYYKHVWTLNLIW